MEEDFENTGDGGRATQLGASTSAGDRANLFVKWSRKIPGGARIHGELL